MARALQVGDTGLHGQHAALHVRGEDRVDVLFGHVGQLDVGEDAGVRADDVDAAEPRRGLGGEPLAVRRLGHVAGDEGDLPALARQVTHGGLAGRGVPAVHDQVRAGACEHAGDSLADALGPPVTSTVRPAIGVNILNVLSLFDCSCSASAPILEGLRPSRCTVPWRERLGGHRDRRRGHLRARDGPRAVPRRCRQRGAVRPRHARQRRLRALVLDGAPPLLERGHGPARDRGSRTIMALVRRGGRGRRRLRPLRLPADGARALVEACRGQRRAAAGPRPRHALPRRRARSRTVEPELSLEGVAGAAYEPDGGFADAQKMCLGWFAAAAARGLRHHLGRRWTPIRVEAGRAVGVETADGFVPPARSCWPPAPGRTICCGPLGAEQPIELRRLQVLVGRTAPGGPLPSAVCSDAVTNVVVRPDRGQQFCAVAYAGEDLLERADDCDHGLSDGYEDAVRARPAKRYPAAGRLRARARLRRAVRHHARLEPDHRPVPRDRRPLPRRRLERPRLQARPRPSARSSRPRSPAERRRSTSASCGPSGSPRAGCCGSPTGRAPRQAGHAPVGGRGRGVVGRGLGRLPRRPAA